MGHCPGCRVGTTALCALSCAADRSRASDRSRCVHYGPLERVYPTTRDLAEDQRPQMRFARPQSPPLSLMRPRFNLAGFL
jgi:hypothetical protein